MAPTPAVLGRGRSSCFCHSSVDLLVGGRYGAEAFARSQTRTRLDVPVAREAANAAGFGEVVVKRRSFLKTFVGLLPGAAVASKMGYPAPPPIQTAGPPSDGTAGKDFLVLARELA